MQTITVPFASYPYLRFLAIFGGVIGVMQSMAWFGLSITALVGYNCNIGFEGVGANYGHLLTVTLYDMYFRSEGCTPAQYPSIDFQAIEDLELLSSSTVNIWMWVVLSLSFVWLLSSLTLLMNVKKSHLKYANVFIYFWVFITLVVSVIDLVLFILFALDYDTIFSHSFSIDLDFSPSSSSVLITAQNSAGIMMSLALRGYVLWLINLLLALYLFTQTFKVYDYNKLVKSGRVVQTSGGQVNNAFSLNEAFNQSVYKNQPIQAFEPSTALPWYNYLTTDLPRVQRNSSQLQRSSSANGLEEAYNKRMTNAHMTSSSKNTFNNEVVLRRDVTPTTSTAPSRQSQNFNSVNYLQTPQPQYGNQSQLKPGILRNSRYQ